MSEPIIFLDVDGVLNHRSVFLPWKGPDPLCDDAVRRFKGLMERTEARVVLSSTWRLGAQPSRQVEKLRAHGVLDRAHEDWRAADLPCQFVRGIIVDDDPRRGREIAEWLGRHPEVTRYAIVDDDGDMLPEQGPFFVQTSFTAGGLQDHHIDRLERILSTHGQPVP